MLKLTDQIEYFIKSMMIEANRNFLEIQRNELAGNFNCAPSQINYVLTTRFTTQKGYLIESKRGGGGNIKITWFDIDKNEYIKNVIWNNIGCYINAGESEAYVEMFFEKGYITERESRLMKAILNDKVLTVPEDIKNQIRAKLLKTMIITILY